MVEKDTTGADRIMEADKLFYDITKHVTTLATVAIVIQAMFLEKTFTEPSFPCLGAAVFVGMFLSILFGLLTMWATLGHIRNQREDLRWLGAAFTILTSISFLASLVSLIVFTVANVGNIRLESPAPCPACVERQAGALLPSATNENSPE